MRQAARVTLFIHDRNGQLEAMPDLEVLHALLEQMPLITAGADGSRTFVFDLVDPAGVMAGPRSRATSTAAMCPDVALESVRAISVALGQAARALGLPMTAALAESAEQLAFSEARARDGTAMLE